MGQFPFPVWFGLSLACYYLLSYKQEIEIEIKIEIWFTRFNIQFKGREKERDRTHEL